MLFLSKKYFVSVRKGNSSCCMFNTGITQVFASEETCVLNMKYAYTIDEIAESKSQDSLPKTTCTFS